MTPPELLTPPETDALPRGSAPAPDPVPPTAPEPAPRAPRPRKGAASNALILKLRRLHLYSGLFLVPWVVVYAVSAILFNHGTWFTGASEQDLPAGALAAWPEPAELAREVVAALQSSSQGGLQLELDEPPTLSTGLARLESAGQVHTLRLEPSGEARVRSQEARERRESPFPRKLEVGRERVRQAEQELALALRASGLLPEPAASPTPSPAARPRGRGRGGRPAAEGPRAPDEPAGPRLQRGPVVRCVVRDEQGARWRVAYDLSRQALQVQPDDERGLGAREFLLRLHLTHGYPSEVSARLVWAIGVDLLALTFLFWCLSGLVMWAQMSKLRRGGLLCLGASLLSAGVLGWAMYAALS